MAFKFGSEGLTLGIWEGYNKLGTTSNIFILKLNYIIVPQNIVVKYTHLLSGKKRLFKTFFGGLTKYFTYLDLSLKKIRITYLYGKFLTKYYIL